MPKRTQRLAKIQNLESQSYTGTQELLDSEAGLIGYSSEIVRKFFISMELHKRIIKENGILLEFGAGTGFLAELFLNKFDIKPDCIELDPKLVTHIRSKNLICFQFLSQIPHQYSAIYTSNVLEHIEDDSKILKELFDALVPGGTIGIYVPAHPVLYSTMDREIGHVRRYKRAELKEKVLNAGFKVQSISYDDFLGFFASLLVKVLGYKNIANLGSRQSLIFYDKVVYPVSRLLDLLGFKHILGKNLIIVAIKES